MSTSNQDEQINKWVSVGIIFFLAVVILYSLSNLISVFLGAVIFYVLAKPVLHVFTQKLKMGNILASLLIILLLFIVILGPTIFIANVFYAKVSGLLQDVHINQTLKEIDDRISDYVGIRLLTEKNIQQVQQELAGIFTNVISQSAGVLGDMALLMLMLFYLLLNSGNMEEMIGKYLPLSPTNQQLLGHELEVQIYSNALGAPVLAVLQGIVASLGYWFFNVPDPIFWGMISGVFSFIPFVGSAMIWLPSGLFLLSQGDNWHGVGVILFGVLVISTVDNLFRFVFQKKIADVHPLITILGIIAGVKLFGLAGLIFGPLLLSYFLILLRIYRERFTTS